ncbi:DUF4238 domain-containing protein [Mucilaginibacter sp. UYCu711]|uniref:DUF4238 domain-containing protein n=1 Tax=Mucilaginibacter sp. UYCu711 TaxID=3156339 RepID=UPI003D1C54EA
MKQHFLPQSYLREFCNAESKLFTLDIDLLKFKRKVFPELKTTAEVCRSKDFYTIKGDFKTQFQHLNGLDPLFLEKKFQEYEREYPKIIAKIKSRQPDLPLQEAELFMYAIIDIKIRNPYFRETAVESKKETVIDTLFDSYRTELAKLELTDPRQIIRKDVMLEEMDKMKEKIMTDEDFGRKTHLSSLVSRQMETKNVQHKISQHLLQFEWRVLYSHNDFFTTDNPGVSIDPTNRPQNTKFTDEFFFFMPLTPHLCLVISSKTPDKAYRVDAANKQIYYADAPKQMIHKINELHGFHVTKYIFSNNQRLIDIIAQKINLTAGL